MDIDEQTLTKLKCATCRLPLSVGPVKSRNKEFICGRCNSGGTLVNTIYEALASKFVFPCSYEPFGCKSALKWGTVKEHEDKCERRTKKCSELFNKYTLCFWNGGIVDVANHVAKSHPECIIKNYRVPIQLSRHKAVYVIKTNRGDYLFYLNFEASDKLKLGLAQLTYPSEFRPHKFQLKLLANDSSRHVMLANADAQTVHLKNYTCTVEEGVLRFLSDGESPILCEILVNDENDLPKALLRLLECPVCKECLRTPISLCVSGHSICDGCTKNLRPYSRCPFCQNQFRGARNYVLEDVVAIIAHSCKNADRGCKYAGSPEDVVDHAENCEFNFPAAC